MRGFIHRMVSHDPDSKIRLRKGITFKGVALKTSHYKRYPTTGEFAGGIAFNRYYGHGRGIGFTAQECADMWGDLRLSEHIVRTVPVPVAAESDTDMPLTTPIAARNPWLHNRADLRVGDSIQVHWEDEKADYTAVILVRLRRGLHACIQTQHTHTRNLQDCAEGEHLCRYDADGEQLWHDLGVEQWTRVPPTAARLHRLSTRQLALRVGLAGLDLHGRKNDLVGRLLDHGRLPVPTLHHQDGERL